MATTRPLDAEQLIDMLYGTSRSLIRDEHELTLRRLAVFLVCYHESRPQTVRGLAKKLKVPKPAITRALDWLEEHSLIRRKQDPLDRRSVVMAHTAAGNAFLRKLEQIMADAAKEVAGRPGL